MACGAPVVGSATAPVQEVIEHGVNGWLVPFFQPETLAEQLEQVLETPTRQDAIRQAGRRTVARRFEMRQCTARMTALLEQVAQGGRA